MNKPKCALKIPEGYRQLEYGEIIPETALLIPCGDIEEGWKPVTENSKHVINTEHKRHQVPFVVPSVVVTPDGNVLNLA